MRSTYLYLLTLPLALLLNACGGGDDGEAGAPGTNGSRTLVAVSAEAAGVHCASGGKKIEAGLDADANGTLAAPEVGSTQYLCNGPTGTAGTAGTPGASGAAGINGVNALVQMLDEPSGAHCAAGGKAINVGFDGNANGVLDASEVSSTGYVCNGNNGAPGTDGTNGANGANGANGLNTLVSIANEPAGANCIYGGSKISTGQDSNANSALDGPEVSSASYVCNGAPDASLKWVNVTGATQQADSNTGYIASNDTAQVIVTLPLSPAPGDIVRISGAGLGGWKIAQNDAQVVNTTSLGGMAGTVWMPRDSIRDWTSVASSADGRKFVAAAFNDVIYTSTDGGVSWLPAGDSVNGLWRSVASSADGSKLVALGYGQNIYTSADGGATWFARDSVRNWQSVASSADGSRLVAVEAFSGLIYTSTDSGFHWTPHESLRSWSSVASSADGSKLVAVVDGGQIYTWTDSGATWVPHESDRNWQSVTSSADGSKLVAVAFGDQIYTSIDSGENWTPRAFTRGWVSVASSADGSSLVATELNGQIYTSDDSGASWTERDSNRPWFAVASSDSGSKLAAVANGGQIYTSSAATTPGVGGSISGGQSDAITLQYVGGGMFNVLSHEGKLTIQ